MLTAYSTRLKQELRLRHLRQKDPRGTTASWVGGYLQLSPPDAVDNDDRMRSSPRNRLLHSRRHRPSALGRYEKLFITAKSRCWRAIGLRQQSSHFGRGPAALLVNCGKLSMSAPFASPLTPTKVRAGPLPSVKSWTRSHGQICAGRRGPERRARGPNPIRPAPCEGCVRPGGFAPLCLLDTARRSRGRKGIWPVR